ncbi:MAG: MotA/TolQ/ExbB proton channel family protein, partial [Gemmatimonadetes bacterium]|nr:MotA/TolQ/ExbB proton channel family protein [Gemmatimonadota bacterium]
MNALSWFASFFQGGGPFMFIILGAGLLILAIALERFWIIGRASAWNSSKFTKDVCEKLKRGDLSGAAALAEKVKSPAGRVAHAIITSGGRSEQSLLNAADGEAVISLARYSHRLAHLGMLGNTATLLGLLGTIFGLTTAFAAVGAADPSQRSAFLAAGISQALNTTAFGLI